MAGRTQFFEVMGYRDTAANDVYKVALTGRVTVYVAPPFAATKYTTLATIYSAETGTGSPGNPFDATTGDASFWVGPGTYDVMIEDTAVPARFTTRYVRIEAKPGDQGVLAAMVGPGVIDASKLTTALAARLHEPGDLKSTARAVASAGWLMCDGAAHSRTSQADLFSAIGTVWGAGDGSTTFNVPDLRGRAPIGAGTAGAGLTARALAAKIGVEGVVLSTAQMPAHNHSASQPAHSHGITDNGHTHDAALWDTPGGTGGIAWGTGAASTKTGAVASKATGISINSGGGDAVTVNSNGGGGSHENMQPSLAVNWMIKT